MESRSVTGLYLVALALIVLGAISSMYQVVDIYLNPKVGISMRSIAPIAAFQQLFFSLLIVTVAAYRFRSIVSGPGLRKIENRAAIVRFCRKFGLFLMALGVLGGAFSIVGTVVALLVRHGGSVLLAMSYLKPWLQVFPILSGLILFEFSRLISFENARG